MSHCAARAPSPPDIIFWDGATPEEGVAIWGSQGLDPYLAADHDLSPCVAISVETLRRLADRGAISGPEEIRQALALLVRSTGVLSVYLPDLVADLDLSSSEPAGRNSGPVAMADRLTVLLVLAPSRPGPEAFLNEMMGQEFTGRTELIIASHGLSSADQQATAAAVDGFNARGGRVKTRRFAVGKEVGHLYFVNAIMAMAVGEAVVIADPAIRPQSPTLFQVLGDWAATSDVAAACPGIEHDGALIASALTLDDSGGLTVGRQHVFSEAVRLAPAPVPWLFAVNRRLWLAAGGISAACEGPLWTSAFAMNGGPAGRTLYVGSQRASWEQSSPPMGMDEQVPLPHAPNTAARLALRGGKAPADAKSAGLVRAAAVEPYPVSPRVVAPAATAPPYYIDDPVMARADMRVLIFADDNGPSQAIPFDLALTQARRVGRISVSLVSERDFPGDSRALGSLSADQQVEAAFTAVRPDVVVVSRLGDAAIWRAVHAAARRLDLPIVFHVDDNLFDLPVTLGIERYRLGRSPRRLATLQSCLDTADLTLATTPALARALAGYTAHGRIRSMGKGSAGGPPAVRSPRDPSGPVRIGYLGSASHNADLAMIAPALNRIAADFPQVQIELFGSIARQPAANLLTALGARHEAISGDYSRFLTRLAELDWDIGLAPLRDITFNALKTPIKWAEYATVGAAVITSRVGPYIELGDKGAAWVVDNGSWEWGLRRLVTEPATRQSLVRAADGLLSAEYRWDRLGQTVETVLNEARACRRAMA